MRRSAVRLALLLIGIGLLAAPAVSPGQNAQGGVAIGGNVSGSTISVGITPAKAEALVRASSANWKTLTDKQRGELRDLERELGVTSGALQTFFGTLGEKQVPAEMLPARLGQIAGAYLALKAQLAGRGADDSPQKAALKEAARTALDAGRLDEADGLLRKVEELQDASLEEQLRQRAQTAEQRATLAMSRLRYKDAAAQFAEAERFAPDDAARRNYAREHARTLLFQAAEFNDAAAQREAVQLLRARLAVADPVTDAEGWGWARRDLGYALVYRGVENATATDLDEAVKLLKEARTAPIAAANTAYRIDVNEIYGQVLCDVAAMRSDTVMAKNGAQALSEAAKDLNAHGATGNAALVDMQMASCNDAGATPSYDMKTALAARQLFIDNRERLNKDQQPFAWAETTVSIAAITMLVGEKEKSLEYLADAVALLRSALVLVTPETSPEIWHNANLALANALAQAGRLAISVAPLEDAREGLTSALTPVRSKPFADREDLELILFSVSVELGLALDDPTVLRAAFDDLRQTGFTFEALDRDRREQYQDIADSAMRELKVQRARPLSTRAADARCWR